LSNDKQFVFHTLVSTNVFDDKNYRTVEILAWDSKTLVPHEFPPELMKNLRFEIDNESEESKKNNVQISQVDFNNTSGYIMLEVQINKDRHIFVYDAISGLEALHLNLSDFSNFKAGKNTTFSWKKVNTVLHKKEQSINNRGLEILSKSRHNELNEGTLACIDVVIDQYVDEETQHILEDA
jgi:hypothetical protein